MIPVKIKEDKYAKAIGLLIRCGGGFQTRYEHTLIVNSKQKEILEAAGLVETGKSEKKMSKNNGQKKKRR